MKLAWTSGAAAALSIVAVAGAYAGVEFGRPDFTSGLSRPGLASCDWNYESYFRACPTPQLPPKPASPAKSKPKS